MNTKSKIKSISKELAEKHGEIGSEKRAKFDEEAYAFYTSQILLDARKSAKITQSQLAKQIGADAAYISRIENGSIIPNVSTFYRIMEALGMRIEISKTVSIEN